MHRPMILSRTSLGSPSLYRVIGLMSGTSLDGVDAALIETDGRGMTRSLGFVTVAYPAHFRDRIRAVFGATDDPAGDIARLAHDLTDHHLAAILALLTQTGLQADEVDLIGFHGQTITHLPEQKFTWQIGDPEHLARTLGVRVVFDFRTADVAAGGQGAPLLPIYHRALVERAGFDRPVALLNLGGVGNITWLGPAEDDLVAFDTGPGNALIDDLMVRHTGQGMDIGGALALTGQVDRAALSKLMEHPYFAARPPKSLDRNAFRDVNLDHLSLNDALATLAAFTAESVARAIDHVPSRPHQVLVTGGGRHNAAIMQELRARLALPVESVDRHALNGDALEAEGFAYMAVRSILELPISFPGTTGAPRAMCGGVVYGEMIG